MVSGLEKQLQDHKAMQANQHKETEIFLQNLHSEILTLHEARKQKFGLIPAHESIIT